MEIKDLYPAEGSRKDRKRVGRGGSSGYGKTAGRGMNGQLSRAGGGKRAGFEGGQTPLARRLPYLPGFGAVVDNAALVEAGIIKHVTGLVKVLGTGELTKALTVKVDKVSASAQAKIEAAGGKVELPC